MGLNIDKKMKTTNYILFYTIALFGTFSCQTEEDPFFKEDDRIVFYAVNDDLAGSRTVLRQDDGAILWTPGDRIKLLAVDKETTYSTTLVSDNSTPAESVKFEGTFDELPSSYSGRFYGIYPSDSYVSYENTGINIRVPSEQVAVAGTYDPSAFVSIAVADGDRLHFKNACGGIRVKVDVSGVKSIEFGTPCTAVAGTALCVGYDGNSPVLYPILSDGSKTITLSAPQDQFLEEGQWYYITAFPTELPDGYSITFLDAEGKPLSRKESSAPVEIKRSVWGSVSISGKAGDMNGNEIRYTTTDGRAIDLRQELQSDENFVSHSFTNGEGRIVFKENLTKTGWLWFFSQDRLKTVTLPEGLKVLGRESFGFCPDLESIHIPESVEEIASGCFYGAAIRSFSGGENVKRIEKNAFLNTPLMSMAGFKNLEEIGNRAFEGCTEFTDIVLPESVKSLGENAFANCSNVTRIRVLPIVPPTGGLGMFDATGMCPIYIPAGSAGYLEEDHWDHYHGRMYHEGDQTPLYHVSTDYSRDGEVVKLQASLEGTGIDIVLLGDGFLDTDMDPEGKYEQRMRYEMEELFHYEPFHSLRHRFNVYTVKAVSANDIYECEGIDHRFFDGSDIYIGTAQEYAEKIPEAGARPLFIGIIFNTKRIAYSDSQAMMDINLCYITAPGAVIAHEFGHLVGHLADEYCLYPDKAFTDFEGLDAMHAEGFYMNVDWHSDPTMVPWRHFLTDSRYAEEALGVYEGGYAYFGKGVYRPTDISMMNSSSLVFHSDWSVLAPERAPFNAPSRECLYKSVMGMTSDSDWVYDYEDFVIFDEPGRTQASGYYASDSRSFSEIPGSE